MFLLSLWKNLFSDDYDVPESTWAAIRKALPELKLTVIIDPRCFPPRILDIMQPSLPLYRYHLITERIPRAELEHITTYFSTTIRHIYLNSGSSAKFQPFIVQFFKSLDRMESIHLVTKITTSTMNAILAAHPNVEKSGNYNMVVCPDGTMADELVPFVSTTGHWLDCFKMFSVVENICHCQNREFVGDVPKRACRKPKNSLFWLLGFQAFSSDKPGMFFLVAAGCTSIILQWLVMNRGVRVPQFSRPALPEEIFERPGPTQKTCSVWKSQCFRQKRANTVCVHCFQAFLLKKRDWKPWHIVMKISLVVFSQ